MGSKLHNSERVIQKLICLISVKKSFYDEFSGPLQQHMTQKTVHPYAGTLTMKQMMKILSKGYFLLDFRALAVILPKWPEGINVKHQRGFTPLTIASNKDNTECVKVLLDEVRHFLS